MYPERTLSTLLSRLLVRGETALVTSCNGNRLTAYVIKQFNNFRIRPTDRLQIRNQAVEFRNCHFFHFLYLPKIICLSAERKQRF